MAGCVAVVGALRGLHPVICGTVMVVVVVAASIAVVSSFDIDASIFVPVQNSVVADVVVAAANPIVAAPKAAAVRAADGDEWLGNLRRYGWKCGAHDNCTGYWGWAADVKAAEKNDDPMRYCG